MNRLMRVRRNQLIRDLVSTTDWNASQLIQPLFAVESLQQPEQIPGLAGVQRQDQNSLLKQIDKDLVQGVRHFLLFCVPAEKKESQFSLDFIGKTVSAIKKRFGQDLFLWTDHCLCSMTKSGHCGLFNSRHEIDVESTLQVLGKMALVTAESGGDGISPSDMMDGRTASIRKVLDANGHQMIPIMSYSTKFSSNFYGPFRQAADSAPSFGDRKTYQIDVRNRTDAINASLRCAQEGADLLMVKPGMTAIDLIRPIHRLTRKPIGAYQVSGEYASLVLLAKEKLINFDQALIETWQVFRRAGAQYIITYGAREAKRMGVFR